MNMGFAIALGAAVGTALGVAMDDVALGAGIGLGAGIALGALTHRRKSNDEGEKSDISDGR